MPVSADLDKAFAWIFGFEGGCILASEGKSQADQNEQKRPFEQRPNVAVREHHVRRPRLKRKRIDLGCY
jgi:hypothetical protein